jgi:hypothetical protein
MNQELLDALSKVIALPDKGDNAYAASYASAAIKHPNTGKQMEGEELKVQLKYVLSNLRGWRGYEAQTAKDILKKYAGTQEPTSIITITPLGEEMYNTWQSEIKQEGHMTIERRLLTHQRMYILDLYHKGHNLPVTCEALAPIYKELVNLSFIKEEV